MLRIRTFGGLAVDRNGVLVTETAEQHKALAVLALVASSGTRGTSRDQLAAWLWPESDAERARGALSQTLYSLRKQLGEPELFDGTRTLRLNARAIECDRLEFEAALERGDADAAIALYVGPFLDGFFVAGSPELERWIDEQRADLARRAHAAMESLASAASERGDLAGAAAWWRRLVSLEPGNSRVVAALVSALSDAGDPGGALQAARSHEEYLEREFDAPPDPVVAALADGIRRRTLPRGRDAAVLERRADVASPPAPGATIRSAQLGEPGGHSPPVGVGGEPVARRIGVRRRALSIILLAAAGIVAAIAIRGVERTATPSATPIVDRRVAVLGLDNETGDTALARVGRVATDWLVQGLVQTQLVQVLAPGIREGTLPALDDSASKRSARFAVRGSYTKAGDSLVMQAEVVERQTGRVVRAVGPVSGPLGEPLIAVEQLRQRLTGTLATLIDPRLSRWSDAASQPTSFEAYRAFQEGLDAFFTDTAYDHAGRLLVHAGSLDSTFNLPLLWAIYAFGNDGGAEDSARSDSLIRALVARRTRMPPFDQALLDVHVARSHWDNAAEYDALRRVVAAAPNSEWMYKLAAAALKLRRYPEADSLLSAIDADAGWLRDWPVYSLVLPEAHYRIGRHQEGIDAAHRLAAGRYQWNFTRGAGRGLAALGRDEELLALVDGELARREPHVDGEILFVIVSAARLHGHVALARALAKRALEPRVIGLELGTDSVIARARYELLVLEHAELWDQAERSAKRLLHIDSVANRHDALPYMVLLQAALRRRPVGDTVGLEARALEEAARWDWQAGGSWMVETPPMVKAELAALRHDAPKAAAMLDEFDNRGRDLLYWFTERPAFDPIRGDPAVPWIHNPGIDRAASRFVSHR